ncbi:MAG TPA: 4a-hydroxytetrahydrobiopterin dehydratase [Thermoanaerobaculia bacterium]|nr:4a-hydroxytetrahydrobiopterin dehydratase [Thermoanaerobaculia bacterium]
MSQNEISQRSTPPSTPAIPPVAGEPGSTGLKAERIQLAPPAETKLKAERIQLALRDLPGWRLQRSAGRITRTLDVADTQQAARLLRHVADLGQAGWEMPEVHLGGGEVTFSLPTVDGGWIEEPHFDLAKALDA